MKALRLSNMGRTYKIEFNHLRILQITGNSETDKSLLVSDFLDQRCIRQDLSNSLVIDRMFPEGLKLITEDCQYDYVIIDNADILVTEEIDKMIKENIKCNTKTYWIIIGRRVYDCVLSTGCIGELEETLVKNKRIISINYSSGV